MYRDTYQSYIYKLVNQDYSRTIYVVCQTHQLRIDSLTHYSIPI